MTFAKSTASSIVSCEMTYATFAFTQYVKLLYSSKHGDFAYTVPFGIVSPSLYESIVSLFHLYPNKDNQLEANHFHF